MEYILVVDWLVKYHTTMKNVISQSSKIFCVKTMQIFTCEEAATIKYVTTLCKNLPEQLTDYQKCACYCMVVNITKQML